MQLTAAEILKALCRTGVIRLMDGFRARARDIRFDLGYRGLGILSPVTENQMDQKMGHEVQAGVVSGLEEDFGYPNICPHG